MIILSNEDIQNSLSTIYDLGNFKLYQLCKENFKHITPDEIIAKTTIIGRTYAAALDRGRKKNQKKHKDINDDFYQKRVVPLFQKSKIDKYLHEYQELKSIEGFEKEILHFHWYLTGLLGAINGQNKRSFSSKYLHFHLPDLYFMYDSRAVGAIPKFVNRKKVKFLSFKRSDKQYSDFFSKAISLQKDIATDHNLLLTPRQIDNLFLKQANEALRQKENR